MLLSAGWPVPNYQPSCSCKLLANYFFSSTFALVSRIWMISMRITINLSLFVRFFRNQFAYSYLVVTRVNVVGFWFCCNDRCLRDASSFFVKYDSSNFNLFRLTLTLLRQCHRIVCYFLSNRRHCGGNLLPQWFMVAPLKMWDEKNRQILMHWSTHLVDRLCFQLNRLKNEKPRRRMLCLLSEGETQQQLRSLVFLYLS